MKKEIQTIHLPIFENDWVVSIYKDRALYSIEAHDGRLSPDESMLIADIMNSEITRASLRGLLDTFTSYDQTKKHEGIETGAFLSIEGLKNIEVVNKLVEYIKGIVQNNREYIYSQQREIYAKRQELLDSK